jgi:hypothetical protein
MLQTTQADRERDPGAVSVIQCRLCPKTQFGTWVTFQRHCKSCEKHPSELRFCSKCGDYFGKLFSQDTIYHRTGREEEWRRIAV